ncbi:MAG TPA: hypothetical protein VEF53_12700 [Patescibacteria group bacterium]|nr:hypothetical protein [Patescibacteria group bacterium]
MNKTKLLVLGSLMACISALFQILPVFLSEAFIILTIFSAIPIYIITRLDPKIGLAAAIISFLLIGTFSIHEALFFLFANGPIGFTLGWCCSFTSRKLLIISISSMILSCTLSFLNFIIAVPIFGTPLSGTLITQILIIFTFSIIYTFIYLYFCQLVFRKLNKFIA